MKKRHLIEVIAFLFMLLFFYAAFNKLVEYQKFKVQIGQSPLLTGFGEIIPWLVISVEIVVGFMLMVPTLRLIGFYASFCLMVMFSIYIIAILNFSSYIPCSCGGVLEKLNWTQHLIFNIAFLVLAVFAILLLDAENVRQEFPAN